MDRVPLRPLQVLTADNEKARETLNYLEQLQHTTATLLGAQEIPKCLTHSRRCRRRKTRAGSSHTAAVPRRLGGEHYLDNSRNGGFRGESIA